MPFCGIIKNIIFRFDLWGIKTIFNHAMFFYYYFCSYVTHSKYGGFYLLFVLF